jgi:colanic acid/amylovoran biosynthesis glycosyltransferase
MKKILIFTNSFPYGISEQFLLDEVDSLSAVFDITILPLFSPEKKIFQKFKRPVTVLAPLFPHSLKGKFRLIVAGIFNSAPIGSSASEFVSNKVFLTAGRLNLWLVATLILRMALSSFKKRNLFLRIKEFDILYFYWGDKSSLLVPAIRKHFSKKILVRFHGSDLYGAIRESYIPYQDQLPGSMDLAVFISDHGNNYFRRKYPQLNFESRTFRLGVNDNGISHPSTDNILRIVTSSNLIPLKRLDLLIESLHQIHFPLIWNHFGDGPERSRLLNMVATLPANIKVEFWGHIPHENLVDFFVNNPVDVFINVSSSEGVPVAIMEALSFGIPVIATNAGGTGEIIDGECGTLLPVELSAAHLVSAIQDFNNRPDKEILRIAARKRFFQFCNAEINYSAFTNFLDNWTSPTR